MCYDNGLSILAILKRQKSREPNVGDVFLIKSKEPLMETRRVILNIKFDKMYSVETGSMLTRPMISISYLVEAKSHKPSTIAPSAESIFLAKRKRMGFDMLKSLADGKRKQSTATPSSSGSSDASTLKTISCSNTIRKPQQFTVDYDSVETTIMTLMKIAPVDNSLVRLVLCFHINKLDVITTIQLRRPFSLSKLKTTIIETPKVNLSAEPERLKSIHLVMGPPEWFYHIPVDDDAAASNLQNNDILKLDIVQDSQFEVTRILSLEERLIVRLEEAKKRGDFVDIPEIEEEEDNYLSNHQNGELEEIIEEESEGGVIIENPPVISSPTKISEIKKEKKF